MKKIISICLSGILAVALLSGCTNSNAGNNTPQNTSPNPANPDTEVSAPAQTNTFDTPVELVWAMAGARGVGSGCAVDKLSDMLSERSGGAITVRCVDGGALGNDADLVNQLIEGTLDVVSTSIGTVSAYYEPLGSIQTPFLVSTYEDEYKVIQSQEWADLVAGANSAMGGARIMATTENGMRHFSFVGRSCETVADLAGTKLRTGGNPIINDAITAIGANPSFVPLTDLFSALQNNVVDGMEINYAMIAMNSYHEIVDYVSEVGLYPFVTVELMSESTIISLPEGYYELIEECFAEFQTWWWTEGMAAWDSEAKQICVDNGVTVLQFQEMDKLRELCAGVYDKVAASDEKSAALIAFAQSLT